MPDDVAKRSLDGMFNTNFMFYLPVHNVNLAHQYNIVVSRNCIYLNSVSSLWYQL